MTIFRAIGAAGMLAMFSVPLTTGAMADHEQTPRYDPPPPPESADSDWSAGFYYVADFSLGDTEDPGTSADATVETDLTLGVGLGFGYRLGPVRLEAQYKSDYHRVYDVEIGATSPLAPGDYAGRLTVESGMANVYFDLPAAGNMRPYLGAGFGFADIKANYNENSCFFIFCSTVNELVSDRDWAWARQAMAGFSHRVEGSNSEFFIGYRYYETDALTLRATDGTPFIQDKLQSHTFDIGIRWFFT